MKPYIVDIKHFAVHDGPGVRTTVFFKGCPLRCKWCHNPEALNANKELAVFKHKCIYCGSCESACKSGVHKVLEYKHEIKKELCNWCCNCIDVCPCEAIKIYGKEMSIEKIMEEILEDKEFYDNSNGGVTLSGGECLLYPDFCLEILKKCKENNIHTAIDTCGYVKKETLDIVIPYTDIFLYDIKAFDEDCHIKCTGFSNKIILDNLKYLDEKNKSISIRIPYVPYYNDNQIEKIANFLLSFDNIVEVKILPYHNYALSKYEALEIKNTLPDELPSTERVKEVQDFFDTILHDKYIKTDNREV